VDGEPGSRVEGGVEEKEIFYSWGIKGEPGRKLRRNAEKNGSEQKKDGRDVEGEKKYAGRVCGRVRRKGARGKRINFGRGMRNAGLFQNTKGM